MTPPTNSPLAVIAVLDEPDRHITPSCAASGSGPPRPPASTRTNALPGSDDPDGGLVRIVSKVEVVPLGGVLTVASFRLCRSSPSSQFRHELWHLSKIRTECDGIFCWRSRHHLRGAVRRLAARSVHRRGPADRYRFLWKPGRAAACRPVTPGDGARRCADGYLLGVFATEVKAGGGSVGEWWRRPICSGGHFVSGGARRRRHWTDMAARDDRA